MNAEKLNQQLTELLVQFKRGIKQRSAADSLRWIYVTQEFLQALIEEAEEINELSGYDRAMLDTAKKNNLFGQFETDLLIRRIIRREKMEEEKA